MCGCLILIFFFEIMFFLLELFEIIFFFEIIDGRTGCAAVGRGERGHVLFGSAVGG